MDARTESGLEECFEGYSPLGWVPKNTLNGRAEEVAGNEVILMLRTELQKLCRSGKCS